MWSTKTRKPNNRRFSYLLLGDGDHYIQDWIASCRPGLVGPGNQKPAQQRRLKGQLRLCSRAIFFEPDYVQAPILMFPFSKIRAIERLPESLASPSASNSKWRNNSLEGFQLKTSLLVKMKENGVDAPYVFEKEDSIWWFSLEFSRVQSFLQQAQPLLAINALPFAERDMILQNAAAQREAQAQFDTSRLLDLSEQVLLDCPAAQVTPLVREPGRLVLTQARVYFQPLHNLTDSSPVRSQPYCNVVAVARRRHALRPTGMEVFFQEDPLARGPAGNGLGEDASAFFTFQNTQQRDMTISMLLEQLGGQHGAAASAGLLLEADSLWLQRVTTAWQARLVSNYDYLMYLNLAAGRSFCDLTQWPIMPWVLNDYKSSKLDFADPSIFRDLSKPVGALNPTRLSVFHERYHQMLEGDNSHPPFLYGTHYSTPGYVLYWLVRAAPAHMLRLQNGRFDAPDRLFASVADSWESVLNNPADLKELIPEFFAPPLDFLVKREGLNLGVRQNGVFVGDVMLPAWAKDPDDFIAKHRQALESQHVSMHLHSWIDLIFGYKQQGKEALAADNLFHHLTYEGAVDLEQVDDPVERAGLEAQINEFGQAPRQLFTTPHPPRLLKRKATVVNSATLSESRSKGFRGLSMEFVSHIMALASSTSDASRTSTSLAQNPAAKLDISPLMRLPSKYQSGVPSVSGRSSKCDPDSIAGGNYHGSAESDSISSNDRHTTLEASSSAFDVMQRVEIHSPSLLRRSSGDKTAEQMLLKGIVPRESGNERTDSNQGWERRVQAWDGKRDDIEDSREGVQFRRNDEIQKKTGDDIRNIRRDEIEGTSKDGREDNRIQEKPSSTKDELQVELSKEPPPPPPWHWMFRQRLSEPQSLKLHRSPINALVLSDENASESLTMYSVGQDGFVKVYSISEGFQVRATKLGNLPLSCLTIAHSTDAYPTVLAGSYDDFVYAYSVDYGRALGKMRVHDETVSCVQMTGNGGQRMVTASWDATVKLWGIAEGRGGWSASCAAPIPEAEFVEHSAAIWSLDVEENGHLAVSGGEDGIVMAWDLQNPTSSVWQAVMGGGVAGVRMTHNANHVAVASTDGILHALEMRQGGAVLATKNCGNPLRCCEIAGQLIITGSVDGALHFWPYEFPNEDSRLSQPGIAEDFLDYSPIRDHSSAINCISLACQSNGCSASLATASNDCTIHVYSVGEKI